MKEIPPDPGRNHAQRHAAESHEGKSLVGDVLGRQARQGDHATSAPRWRSRPSRCAASAAQHPSSAIWRSNQRRVIVLGDAGAEDEELLRPGLGNREIADQLALVVQHGRKHDAPPGAAMRLARISPSQPSAPAPLTSYLAKPEVFDKADGLPHRAATPPLPARRRWSGGSSAFQGARPPSGREPQRGFQSVAGAEDRVLRLEALVDRRGPQGAAPPAVPHWER